MKGHNFSVCKNIEIFLFSSPENFKYVSIKGTPKNNGKHIDDLKCNKEKTNFQSEVHSNPRNTFHFFL